MTNPSSTYTQEPVLIIEPGRTEKNYWAALWRYRELFLIFKRPFRIVQQPAATLVTAFIDFLISFIILIGMMIFYQFAPGWPILLLPAFIILALLASLGPGLWITALNVKYRDFRYIIPFVVQFGLYISPVASFNFRFAPT